MVQLQRGLVARLGSLHSGGPLTGNLERLVDRPALEVVVTPILTVYALFGVANHPVLPCTPIAALLVLRHVDAEEVSEAVVALALVEVGIELGAPGRRRGRWQLVQGELLSLVRGAIHHLVHGAEGRGLSASHQPCSHQHIQVVRIVEAWAGEEVVAADAAAI